MFYLLLLLPFPSIVGSGDLLSGDFNPVMFLLEKHCASSFDELQCGRNNLRREVSKSEQAPAQFIRDNLDAFIQCYDTLSDILFLFWCLRALGRKCFVGLVLYYEL